MKALSTRHFGIYMIALAAIVAAALVMGFVGGWFGPGLEQTGGVCVTVQMSGEFSVQSVEAAALRAGCGDVSVQRGKLRGNLAPCAVVKAQTDAEAEAFASALLGEVQSVDANAQVLSFGAFEGYKDSYLFQGVLYTVSVAAFFMFIYALVRYRWEGGFAFLAGVIAAAAVDISLAILLHGVVHIDLSMTGAALSSAAFAMVASTAVLGGVRESVRTVKSRTSTNYDIADHAVSGKAAGVACMAGVWVLAALVMMALGGAGSRQLFLSLALGAVGGAFSAMCVVPSLWAYWVSGWRAPAKSAR